MAQTDASTYGFALNAAQAGQKYDIRNDVVASFAAEEEIEPGQPVMRGTDPGKQVVVSDASGFVGVALFTHTLEQAYPTGGASYAEESAVSVLTKGAVYVESSVADVVAGETAYVTAAGAYTNVEGSNLAIGTFLTSGDENDLVVVELN
jgi:hypothetical protein